MNKYILLTKSWSSFQSFNVISRLLNNVAVNATNQIDYIKAVLSENHNKSWSEIKSHALNIKGTANENNIDGIILKVIVSTKNFDAALSYIDHLKKSSSKFNIGIINGLLSLYHEKGKEKSISEEEKKFILESYKSLYDKYKVLDSVTSERLLHALCTINEFKKAHKVLGDIHISSKPSHSAYSTLIATFFKNNKKVEAMKLIEESVNNSRFLTETAYEEWIAYIFRKYKNETTIAKYLDEICAHVCTYNATITLDTAQMFQNAYRSIGWATNITKIGRTSGQCVNCNQSLEHLKVSEEEFKVLQTNVKEKLIVGSDLFLKSSPPELKRYLEFVDKTAPYDLVLDALNISFAVGKGFNKDRLNLLRSVVDHFANQNKKMLVIGRKHMLKWPQREMQYIMSKTFCFFTDDLSQDDPYFITAAILSGPNTDIVSKDLLRGHRFRLKSHKLKAIFQRWQWQHQWMIFTRGKNVIYQPPLQYTPCAQRNSNGWHIPFESPVDLQYAKYNHGTPDMNSWICLRNKVL